MTSPDLQAISARHEAEYVAFNAAVAVDPAELDRRVEQAVRWQIDRFDRRATFHRQERFLARLQALRRARLTPPTNEVTHAQEQAPDRVRDQSASVPTAAPVGHVLALAPAARADHAQADPCEPSALTLASRHRHESQGWRVMTDHEHVVQRFPIAIDREPPPAADPLEAHARELRRFWASHADDGRPRVALPGPHIVVEVDPSTGWTSYVGPPRGEAA